MKITCAILTTLFLFSSATPAQEEARAAWQVTNFDIAANIQQAERILSAAAILNVSNIGRGTGTSFTFRITTKASIKSVTVGGAAANVRSVAGVKRDLQRVTVTLPASVAGGGTLVININYTLPVESNTGLTAISPSESQFLPLSFWYPLPNTLFTVRGADTAPFRLVVNSGNVISSGMEKSGSPGSTVYEQPLSAQPFFVQGDWERIEGSGDGKNITAFVPRGASQDEKTRAEAIISLTANARAYYANLFGPAPEVPIESGFRHGADVIRSDLSFVDWWANPGKGRGWRAVARSADPISGHAVPRKTVWPRRCQGRNVKRTFGL